jgi:uncharacterized Tic20 family protein
MASTSERFDTAGREGDTTLAAITHLLALFTWVVGPLVVYVVTDDPEVLVDRFAAYEPPDVKRFITDPGET